ncbi:MAG: betaine/proline/choline family ABC transporter ATP-binding protein [Dehalococcoidia bacterium]|nr:betaine/proline/choline family ABC transporter ATP-binding protein [Dehalococcoidia bacterium]
MIKLENLTKIYPDGTKAVKDVSLDVEDGMFCVLLGPSGCGKTTTMKMINRLIPITSGKIYIDDVDITAVDLNELRRGIGYAIQEIGLFPHMTVAQNISVVPWLRHWSKSKQRERAEELLQLVGLNPSEFMNKYPSELSGGQRQRVGVARALGADPPILLMDEPFGAIDPITRDKLQNEFLKIQEKIKKTIIFVTHDIYEAIKMADKIALMKEGELIQYDSPKDLLYGPADEFVANFVGADRALKGLQLIRVKAVMGHVPYTIKMEDPANLASEKMEEEGLDQLPVVNDKGVFTGWINKSDLPSDRTIGDVMTPAEVTVGVNTVLNEALSLMLDKGLVRLPVVDIDNILEGILNFEDIRKGLSEASGQSG